MTDPCAQDHDAHAALEAAARPNLRVAIAGLTA